MAKETTPPVNNQQGVDAINVGSKTDATAKETVNALSSGPRTPEQRDLAEASNGKIDLRVNDKGVGVIDLYTESGEMICKGAQRLKRLTANDYFYFIGEQAIEETKLQKLKLFSKETVEEKTKAFLQTFGTTGVEQSKNLSILFGDHILNYRCRAEFSMGTGINHSTSYLGLSEVRGEYTVYCVKWTKSGVTGFWGLQELGYPFLAFEDC